MTTGRSYAAAARLAVAALVACALAPAAARAQIAPPVVSASFAQELATAGVDVGVSFTVSNPNPATTLTGVAFGATLPAGLVISTPSELSTSCDGTVTAPAGGSTITLSGATLQPAGEETSNSCAVVLDVVAPAPGVVSISAGAPTSAQTGAGSSSAPASLQVLAMPTIGAAFAPASIRSGETATLTYTLANPNAAARLYGLAFDDALAGLAVASPANVAGTCATDAVLAEPGATTISLLDLTIEGASSCTISVDVRGTGATIGPNPTGPLTFAYDAGGGDLRSAIAPGASAAIVVIGPPLLSSAFGAASIVRGASTTLTFTLANPNPLLALTGIGFTAALAPGLVVATPPGVGGSCPGGSIAAAAGSGSIALGGAMLAPAAGCAFSVGVTGLSEGPKTSTASAVSSLQAGSGAGSAASLLVTASPPPPAAPPPPSNAFKVLKARVARDGTVRFDLTVAGAGVVTVVETLGFASDRASTPGRFTIARRTLRPTKGGARRVTVTPNARGRRAIRTATRKRRINLKVTFRPTGATAGRAVTRRLVVPRR